MPSLSGVCVQIVAMKCSVVIIMKQIRGLKVATLDLQSFSKGERGCKSVDFWIQKVISMRS